MYASFLSCAIVMTSNLCFSYRGLYQKLFRANATAGAVDDLNVQFRMQQLGVMVLLVPTLVWDGPGILHHLYQVSTRNGLFHTGILVRYIGLATINGLAFTSYK